MKLYLIIFAIIFTAALVKAQPLFQATNLDFEEASTETAARGWKVPSSAKMRGYRAFLTDSTAIQGKRSLKLVLDSSYQKGIYGSIMQSIDAKPYRGKRIIFSAAVKIEGDTSRSSAHLWFREHREDGREGYFYDMEDAPIKSGEWAYYEIPAYISENAKLMNFGLMVKGDASGYIDDAAITIDYDSFVEYSPAKELSDEEARNIASFVKLAGFVRFFHPSPKAAAVDWNKFLLSGIEAAEKARNSAELVETLKSRFLPISDGLLISVEDDILKREKNPIPQNALSNFELCRLHNPLIGENPDELFSTRIINIYQPRRTRDGSAIQVVPIENLDGKSVRFSARARALQYNESGQAQLWMRFDNDFGEELAFVASRNHSKNDDAWEEISIESEIPEGAAIIRLGLVALGDGRVCFDNAQLNISGANDAAIKNGDFEDAAGDVPKRWLVPNSVELAGYKVFVDDYFSSGSKVLVIESDTSSIVSLPKSGETYSGKLPSNIYFNMPLTAYKIGDDAAEYYAPPQSIYKSSKPENYALDDKDRISRLAIAADAWTRFSLFALHEKDALYWNKALLETLKRASANDGDREFLETLNRLCARLNDGQARVWKNENMFRYGPPFLWREFDDGLFVTKTAPECAALKPGDKIVEIDGESCHDKISSAAQAVSGASEAWKRLRALAILRAGTFGSAMKLKIRSANGETKEINVERNLLLSELVEEKPKPIVEIQPGIAYIDMTSIDDVDFRKVLPGLKTMKGIVFDMRGVCSTSEYFLRPFLDSALASVLWRIPLYAKPEHKLISYADMQGALEPYGEKIAANLVFIIDERTIGYGLGTLSIIKHYKLGTIVGKPTAATDGDVYAGRLFGFYAYSTTGAFGVSPAGKLIYFNPIQPDILINYNLKDFLQNKDALIEAAIEAAK